MARISSSMTSSQTCWRSILPLLLGRARPPPHPQLPRLAPHPARRRLPATMRIVGPAVNRRPLHRWNARAASATIAPAGAIDLPLPRGRAHATAAAEGGATMANGMLSYDPAAHYEVKVEDIEYRRDGDRAWLALTYQPQGEGPFPALLEIHGGAWNNGERTGAPAIGEGLGARGGGGAAGGLRLGGGEAQPPS